MDYYERLQETARQLQEDRAHHERFCPNCSAPSPSGNLCQSCMVMLADTGQTREKPHISFEELLASGFIDTHHQTDPSDSNSSDESIEGEDRWVTLEDHHILPVQFKDKFQAAGLDIDMYMLMVYQFQHKILHSDGWNDDWKMFFDVFDEAKVKPTVDDVMDYAVYMIEKYGLEDAIPHRRKDASDEYGAHLY
jgi:Predicted lipoprotein of unknown function (DUF2380)